MNKVVEAFEGIRITATYSSLGNPVLAGFLCDASSSGTLTIADKGGASGGDRTLLSAMALTAGNYYPLNVRCSGQVTITIGGTASGLLTYAN